MYLAIWQPQMTIYEWQEVLYQPSILLVNRFIPFSGKGLAWAPLTRKAAESESIQPLQMQMRHQSHHFSPSKPLLPPLLLLLFLHESGDDHINFYFFSSWHFTCFVDKMTVHHDITTWSNISIFVGVYQTVVIHHQQQKNTFTRSSMYALITNGGEVMVYFSGSYFGGW